MGTRRRPRPSQGKPRVRPQAGDGETQAGSSTPGRPGSTLPRPRGWGADLPGGGYCISFTPKGELEEEPKDDPTPEIEIEEDTCDDCPEGTVCIESEMGAMCYEPIFKDSML